MVCSSRGRALALAAAVLLTGCSAPMVTKGVVTLPPETLKPLVSQAVYEKEYVLAPDDQLDIVVQRAPEVSRAVVIRPDGYISLPLLDDVKAGGLTVRELDAVLTERFGKRLLDPEVTVIATKVRPSVIYVTGQVNNPTPVPLRDAPTALQAIAVAQGFKTSASPGGTMLIRLGADGHLAAIPLADRLGEKAGPLLSLRSVALQPDDLIFVPESGRNQFGRFLEDFVTRPLAGFNSIFAPYVNFRLLEEINNPSNGSN
jgi:polysaccharide export outer membrane protein